MSKSGLRIKHFRINLAIQICEAYFPVILLNWIFFQRIFSLLSEFVFLALEIEQIPGTMCLWWSTRLHLSSEKKKVQNNAIQSVLLRLPLVELPNYVDYQCLKIRAHSVFVKDILAKYSRKIFSPDHRPMMACESYRSLIAKPLSFWFRPFQRVHDSPWWQQERTIIQCTPNWMENVWMSNLTAIVLGTPHHTVSQKIAMECKTLATKWCVTSWGKV